MKYEVKKILSCKILVISLAIAFIFGIKYSYYVFFNGKTDLSRYSSYIGEYSIEKHQEIEKKFEELQLEYEETQSKQTRNEMFEYLSLLKDAEACQNLVEYRDKVASDSESRINTESGYYLKINKITNRKYSNIPRLTIGKSQTLYHVNDFLGVTDIVDIAFIIVLILFSSFVFLNEHKCNTFNMIKSSKNGGNKTYWKKVVISFAFSLIVSAVQTIGMTILSVFANDIEEWNTSILLCERFLHSPYNINLWQFIIIMTIMRALGYFVLTSVFICVSLFFKNNIIPIAINTLIGLGGFAANYVLSGKYFALAGGVVREAEYYHVIRKYTPFPLISESANYFMEYEPINILGQPVQLLNYSLICNLLLALIIIIAGSYFYNTNFREKGA